MPLYGLPSGLLPTTLYLPAMSRGVVGALLVVEGGVLVFVVWGFCGVSGLLLVEEVDDLQLITHANSKAKEIAAWARDCSFIVVSFDLNLSVKNMARYIGPPIPGGIPPPGIAIPPIGVPGAGLAPPPSPLERSSEGSTFLSP